MQTTKWTNESVLKVIQECRKAGRLAANQHLATLQASGPKFNVIDDMQPNKPIIGQLLDVCGFAWIIIPARGKFYLLAKKLSESERFRCQRAYKGGGHLSIFDTTMRQEMSVNVAANKAMTEVLKKYNIDACVHSRID